MKIVGIAACTSGIAHTSLGTGEYGAVRASLSFMNTPAEIDAFSLAVNRL